MRNVTGRVDSRSAGLTTTGCRDDAARAKHRVGLCKAARTSGRYSTSRRHRHARLAARAFLTSNPLSLVTPLVALLDVAAPPAAVAVATRPRTDARPRRAQAHAAHAPYPGPTNRHARREPGRQRERQNARARRAGHRGPPGHSHAPRKPQRTACASRTVGCRIRVRETCFGCRA